MLPLDRFDKRGTGLHDALYTHSQFGRSHPARISNPVLGDECIVCRTVVLRRDRFDEREKDFYDALYTQSQAQFSGYVEAGVVLNNYMHIFEMLIRLRQACPAHALVLSLPHMLAASGGA